MRPANRAPQAVGTIPAGTITAGESVGVDMGPYFTDPDGDALTYSAEASDAGVAAPTVSGGTVTIFGVAVGEAAVTVTARDPGGLTASQRFAVTVTPPNAAPRAVGTINALSVRAGERTSVRVGENFTDPNGDALAFTAETSDAGVATAAASGDTVTVSGVAAGEATVTVTATDPGGLTASHSVAVTVGPPNQAPETVGAIDALSMKIGGAAVVTVAEYFTDPDGDALTFSAETSDAGVATAAVSGDTLTVTGAAVGEATVTVTAADPGGLTATQSVAVTVTANRPPGATGTIPARSVTVGQSAAIALAGYFTDPDGDTLAFSAESSDAGVATAAVSGDTLTVTGAAVGEATVTVTAADPAGLTATQSFVVTVGQNHAPRVVAPIPAQELTQSETTSINLIAYFTDPNGDHLTFSAESSTPAVATAQIEASNRLIFFGVAQGEAELTVTARDPGNLTATQTVTVTVAAAGDIIFRDDFDTAASLENWATDAEETTAIVADGVLRLTENNAGQGATAAIAFDGPLRDWKVLARLGRTNPASSFSAVWVVTDHPRYRFYRLDVGSGITLNGQDTNYRFLIYDGEANGGQGGFFFGTGTTGFSEAIHDGANEFTNITWILGGNGELSIRAGARTLLSISQLRAIFPRRIISVVLVSHPYADAMSSGTALFDWVQVNGTYIASDVGPAAALPDHDLRRAIEAAMGAPIKRGLPPH